MFERRGAKTVPKDSGTGGHQGVYVECPVTSVDNLFPVGWNIYRMLHLETEPNYTDELNGYSRTVNKQPGSDN